ncbi:CHRD domain-containing protein [Parerythrobacter jejuensis]|uniref:CHRD domain-containing protein n=1 Tax=Parerythrobacter jejuensis TaxID=795812 RepID=A0A845B124_9SPHN|nr:CHRD domain-containing protein [Parerythrobacter jejuensis]MXP32688.1 CHRD domain-containing protein [Parerythrobacter jejuensis]
MMGTSRFTFAPVAATLMLGAAPILTLSAQVIPPPEKLYVFTALDGEAVVGGGAEEGFADFNAEIDPKTGEVCYTFTAGDVEMTVAHIHKGDAGENGPPVMTLELTPDNTPKCDTVEGSLARSIGNKPGQYYVNLHTAEFPGGAIRGQLED